MFYDAKTKQVHCAMGNGRTPKCLDLATLHAKDEAEGGLSPFHAMFATVCWLFMFVLFLPCNPFYNAMLSERTTCFTRARQVADTPQIYDPLAVHTLFVHTYHTKTHTKSHQVPGAASCWEQVVKTWGTLPLAQVLAPAVELAEEGFPVQPVTAFWWRKGARQIALADSAGGWRWIVKMLVQRCCVLIFE